MSELPSSTRGATPARPSCREHEDADADHDPRRGGRGAARSLAAPAQGASRLVVRGAGFGHGVGMSQYGALGFAQRGSDHASILRHYYSGTQIGRLSGLVTVRILLRTAPRARFRGIVGVAGGRRLEPGRTYTAVRALGGNVALRSASGRDLGTYRSPLVLVGAAGGVRVLGKAGNGVTNGRYRGDLELRAGSLGGISAINAVSLEDYIRGVVPGEVPASWPDAALRAQAVAARTYAIATSKNGDGFDQYADTRSQMYPGISGEHPRTNAAVQATGRPGRHARQQADRDVLLLDARAGARRTSRTRSSAPSPRRTCSPSPIRTTAARATAGRCA